MTLKVKIHVAATTFLWPFVRDYPGELVPEETYAIFWVFWCKGKITKADAPIIWLDATLSRLIGVPTSIIPTIFMPDALPVATLPIYPGLGQAPSMLACIPSGLVENSCCCCRKILVTIFHTVIMQHWFILFLGIFAVVEHLVEIISIAWFVVDLCLLMKAKWVAVLSSEYPTMAYRASIKNPFGRGALINLLRQFGKVSY